MQTKVINFKIVTPEKIVYEEKIKKLILPTSLGQITILPDHEPLAAVVEPGEVCIQKLETGEVAYLAINKGFLEVEDNVARIFADTAERLEDLDEQAIIKAQKEAKEALKNKKSLSQLKFIDAEARLKREMLKLKILRKHKFRKHS